MENIPTRRVLRYADSIRVLQSTDISRILIVIQNGIVVQIQGIISEIDDRLAPSCQGAWRILWLATGIYLCPRLVSTAQEFL